MRVEDLLSIDRNFSQIVKFPTRKDKTLDIVVTDIDHHLDDPARLPPILVDDNKTGAPSDHDGVLISPRNNWSVKMREGEERIVRPFPNSGILRFGKILVKEDWEYM